MKKLARAAVGTLTIAAAMFSGQFFAHAETTASSTVTDMDVQAMYRLYNPNSGEHFYTSSSYERDELVKIGWRYEGIGWWGPAQPTNTPVYRVYNPNAGDHHYTTSPYERDALVQAGWNDEGTGWYSYEGINGTPVYRQYNPNAIAGAHNYTTSKVENDHLVSVGWSYEGVGWTAAPSSTTGSDSAATPGTTQNLSTQEYFRRAANGDFSALAGKYCGGSTCITLSSDGTVTMNGEQPVRYSVREPDPWYQKGNSAANNYHIFLEAPKSAYSCRLDSGQQIQGLDECYAAGAYEANIHHLPYFYLLPPGFNDPEFWKRGNGWDINASDSDGIPTDPSKAALLAYSYHMPPTPSAEFALYRQGD